MRIPSSRWKPARKHIHLRRSQCTLEIQAFWVENPTLQFLVEFKKWYIYSQCSPEFCPHIICPSGKSKKSVWHRVAVVTGIPNPIRPPLALNSNDSVSSLGPIFVRPFQIRRKRSSNNNNFKTYFWRAFAHFGTLCVYNSTVDKNTFKRVSFSKYLNFCTLNEKTWYSVQNKTERRLFFNFFKHCLVRFWCSMHF